MSTPHPLHAHGEGLSVQQRSAEANRLVRTTLSIIVHLNQSIASNNANDGLLF
jgi:hypothetical protein